MIRRWCRQAIDIHGGNYLALRIGLSITEHQRPAWLKASALPDSGALRSSTLNEHIIADALIGAGRWCHVRDLRDAILPLSEVALHFAAKSTQGSFPIAVARRRSLSMCTSIATRSTLHEKKRYWRESLTQNHTRSPILYIPGHSQNSSINASRLG
jgi:hypothetical protein